MKYPHVEKAIFINRPNRFIANVELGGNTVSVHVKNTGRCKELLIPGCTVYLNRSENPNRKTAYDLIAVEKICQKDKRLINMDSQVVNDVVAEWLADGGSGQRFHTIRREVAYHKSRFDFYLENRDHKIFLEVKGVTLENNGIVSFPDAPTERGVKHIKELISCLEDGFEGHILFVIQMQQVREMRPNEKTHAEFARILRLAAEKGVGISAMDCRVMPDRISIQSPVPVNLSAGTE